jgi:hypothetical protein
MFAHFNFLQYLFPWRRTRFVEQVAGEVARQCHASLLRRVGQHLEDMSLAQIRGYVRAQARECVEEEVGRTLHRRHLIASYVANGSRLTNGSPENKPKRPDQSNINYGDIHKSAIGISIQAAAIRQLIYMITNDVLRGEGLADARTLAA